MKHSIHTMALPRHVTRARDFFDWVEEDGDTLIAAADLLGGPNWAERARAVVAVARNGGPVTARVRTLAEEFAAEAAQTDKLIVDPYHLHWPTTRDGAALWAIAKLLCEAIQGFEAACVTD